MNRYALIIGNTVANIVEQADTPTIEGQWVNVTNQFVGPGFTYDGTDFTEPTFEQKPQHISVGAFFDRFGAHKYPILASTDLGVQALIKDCTVRSFIDLTRPDLPLGLGIITAAGFAIDTNAILTNPIQEYERP